MCKYVLVYSQGFQALWKAARADEPLPYVESHMKEYILPDSMIHELLTSSSIQYRVCPPIVQPASLDIPLCGTIREVKRIFIPNGNTLESQMVEVSSNELTEQTLYPDHVYVIESDTFFLLPKNISAISESRSTAGRNDIFVALIAQQVRGFNALPRGYIGNVSFIVSPRSYPIKVREGDSLAQLKFVHMHTTGEYRPRNEFIDNKIFHVNLKKDKNGVVAYESIYQTAIPLAFDAVNDHDSSAYWRPLIQEDALTLHPGPLYILRSIEKVSIPSDTAMSLISHNRSRGEFHSHYAGFFDPGFGADDPTPVVLEVRVSMELDIHHGDSISEGIHEALLYPSVHPYKGNYSNQDLRLGKQFIQ